MIANGYTMDLYCDREEVPHPYGCFPQTFTGETRAEVTRYARRRGWVINWQLRTAVCPLCSGKKRTPQCSNTTT